MSGNEANALPGDEEMLEAIRRIALHELEIPAKQAAGIDMDSPLAKELQMDSLAQVIFITQMEEKFGLIFELEDRARFEKVETVRDLIQVVRQCSGENR